MIVDTYIDTNTNVSQKEKQIMSIALDDLSSRRDSRRSAYSSRRNSTRKFDSFRYDAEDTRKFHMFCLQVEQAFKRDPDDSNSDEGEAENQTQERWWPGETFAPHELKGAEIVEKRKRYNEFLSHSIVPNSQVQPWLNRKKMPTF